MAHKNNRQITIDNTRKYRKTDTHTHTHPFNGPFFRDYPGEPVPER